jgi:hypothetical protein
MDSSIDDAIAEAKAQASRLPVIINARKLTMSDLESSSLDVESWLQVDKYGLHLDKSQEALEALLVEIDLNEIVPVYMVRFGKNPPNYCRSYDGVTTFGSPKPWELTVREGQHLDADCRGQYSAVEIPMTLTEAVELKRDRKTVEGGTRIGYTTSITGYRPFQKFWNECEKKGPTDAVVKVKLAYETRKSNGNEWGVVSTRSSNEMLRDRRRHQDARAVLAAVCAVARKKGRADRRAGVDSVGHGALLDVIRPRMQVYLSVQGPFRRPGGSRRPDSGAVEQRLSLLEFLGRNHQ